MAVTQQRPGPLRGSDGQVFDLSEAAVTKKKSRVPEIALGVLLIAGCALAALAWQTIADPSRQVWATRNDIARGEIIQPSDLQRVEIASNDILNVIAATDVHVLSGRIAQVDLAAGTLLTAEMVADVADIESGQALVGWALNRGALPTSTLRVGSLVDVVVTPAQSGDDSFRQTEGTVLVRNASVAEIASDGGDVLLSLAVSEADAVGLARAVAADRVRLVAVPDDRDPADTNTGTDAGAAEADEGVADQTDSSADEGDR